MGEHQGTKTVKVFSENKGGKPAGEAGGHNYDALSNDIKAFRFYLEVVRTIQSHGRVTELRLILKFLLTNDSLFVLYALFPQKSKECQSFEH